MQKMYDSLKLFPHIFTTSKAKDFAHELFTVDDYSVRQHSSKPNVSGSSFQFGDINLSALTCCLTRLLSTFVAMIF